MIVLVPLSRYRISYEVASGRPFSEFERAILRAIRAGATSVEALRDTFEIHPRLLIEGLVTLTHAGWLAVGGPRAEGFVLTSQGHEAAVSDEPPSTLVIGSRHTFIVMERFSGGLIPNKDVRFASSRDLEDVWEDAARLPTEFPANQLDEGQVQHLLPCGKGEWVRWIGPIDLVSKNAHWLPLNVDLDTERVSGLPDAWQTRLSRDVLDVAKQDVELDDESRTRTWPLAAGNKVRSRAEGAESSPAPRCECKILISCEDFLFTQQEHEQLLIRALSEGHTIFLNTAILNVEKLEAIRPRFEEALKRGASIDLLWGFAPAVPDSGTALKWLQKLSYDHKRNGAKGVLQTNLLPSRSHAKFLIWGAQGEFEACVGAYDWLSETSTPDDGSIYASVRTNAPSMISALARCAASFWHSSESESLASAGDRWRRIAADLEREAMHNASPFNAKARLVLDREHEALLQEVVIGSSGRLLISSKWLRQLEALIKGLQNNKRGGQTVEMAFGDTDLNDIGSIVGELANSRPIPRLNANALVGDALTCVSSFNFLGTDPSSGANEARELGIVIESQEIADCVWDRLHKIQ